jgi:hypothetical protein
VRAGPRAPRGRASGARPPGGRRWVSGLLLLGLGLVGPGSPAAAADARPEILHVGVPSRLVAGQPAELRLTYRAPRADVVAVIEVSEDLDGAQRGTRQREWNVLARAFGVEAGELGLPVVFARPGRKRIVLTLVTDERRESEPAVLEVDVRP